MGGAKKKCYIQLIPITVSSGYGVSATARDNIGGNIINVTSDVKVAGYVENSDGGSVFLMDDLIIKKGTSSANTGNISKYSITARGITRNCELIPTNDSTYKYLFDTRD